MSTDESGDGRSGFVVSPGPPLPDRSVLRDADADAELRRRGLVVVDLLNSDELARLRDAILGIYRGERTGQHYTLLSTDMDYRHSVFDTVPELLDTHAQRLFDDYVFCASSLAFKWPGEDAVLGPHQDISMVDETRFRSYNLWVPLVDTDVHNGAVRYLMGSHRVLDNLRTMPSVPNWFEFDAFDIDLDEFEPVPVRAGQAIVFDHAMLHGSGPNLSDEVRPAVIAAYRPAEAQLLHYFVPDMERPEVSVYEADDQFYRNQLVGRRPERAPDRTIEYYGTQRTREQVLGLSRALVAPAAVPNTDPEASTSSSSSLSPLPLELRFPRPPVARTLLDDGLQTHLEEFGYVVFDALEPADVAVIREIVDEVYPLPRSGFHASNVDGDHQFRRDVHDRVGPLLEERLAPLLDDHVLFSTLSTMKFPGQDSGFVVHQDWTVVDENHYRGVNIWCPLVDTDEHNGGMLVLPGSHLHLGAVRCGPDWPDWYQAPGVRVTWDDMLPIAVRVGQALMFDHRLLHSSGPNHSDELRPAVVAAMAPRSAGLFHWFRPTTDARELEVLSIDSDFFCDVVIGERPSYPTVATIPFRPDPCTPEQLVASCAGAIERCRNQQDAAARAPEGAAPSVEPHHRVGRAARLVRRLVARG